MPWKTHTSVVYVINIILCCMHYSATLYFYLINFELYQCPCIHRSNLLDSGIVTHYEYKHYFLKNFIVIQLQLYAFSPHP